MAHELAAILHLSDMADASLITAVAKDVAAGIPEDQIITRLVAGGRSEADVRGALALVHLQQLGTQPGHQRLAGEIADLTSEPASTMRASTFPLVGVLLVVLAGAGMFFLAPKGADFFARIRTASTTPSAHMSTDAIEHTYTHTYTFATTTKRQTPQAGASAPVANSPAPQTYQPTTPSAPAPMPVTGETTKPVVDVRLREHSIAPGESTLLSWEAKYADSCSSTGFDIGGQRTGSMTVTPSVKTTYTLTCTSDGGTDTDKVTLSISVVEEPPPEQVAEAPIPTPDPVPTTLPPEPTPAPPPPEEPGPPQEIPPIDPSPESYAVYPGCETPATSYARELYIDPIGGSDSGDGSKTAPYRSLAAVITAKKIQAGDHIILLPGEYGRMSITSANSPQLANPSAWTWFDFQSGAIGQVFTTSSVSRLLITGLELSTTQATSQLHVWISRSSQIVVADALIYSGKDSSNWTVNDWMKVAATGMQAHIPKCVAFTDNTLKNLRGGMSVLTEAKTPAENSAKVLFARNTIRNFSADGMVTNGSDIIVRDNKFYDQYVGQDQGDPNHDDGLQIFALGGAVFDNIRIEDNWFQETTSTTRPFISAMQAISLFDGLVTNMRVTGNVVISSHWHGIALYGTQNSLVDHNTVANWSTNGRATWISVPAAKGNAWNPTGTKVTNNIAVTYILGTGTIAENNQSIKDPASVFKAFDRTTLKFDLHPLPGSVIDGANVGAYPTKTALQSAAKTWLLAGVGATFDAIAQALQEFGRSLRGWVTGS